MRLTLAKSYYTLNQMKGTSDQLQAPEVLKEEPNLVGLNKKELLHFKHHRSEIEELFKPIKNETVQLSSLGFFRAEMRLHDSYALSKAQKEDEKKLRTACRLGKISKVRELLGKGVDMDAVDAQERTALHHAVMREAYVKATKPKYTQQQIETAQKNHPAVIDLLLKKGGNPTIKTDASYTPYDMVNDIINQKVKDVTDLDIEIAKKILTKFKDSGLLPAYKLFHQ